MMEIQPKMKHWFEYEMEIFLMTLHSIHWQQVLNASCILAFERKFHFISIQNLAINYICRKNIILFTRFPAF